MNLNNDYIGSSELAPFFCKISIGIMVYLNDNRMIKIEKIMLEKISVIYEMRTKFSPNKRRTVTNGSSQPVTVILTNKSRKTCSSRMSLPKQVYFQIYAHIQF